MAINLEEMQNLVELAPSVMISREHGESGGIAFRAVSAALKGLFKQLPPDCCSVPLVVFAPLNKSDVLLEETQAMRIRDIRSIHQDVQGASGITIQVSERGEMLLWKMLLTEAGTDETTLAARAVVYRYEKGEEFFFANDKSQRLTIIDTTYASCYAAPTFNRLREALEAYRIDVARHSSCKILETAWGSDKNRVFLKNRPESILRDSLNQFLSHHLRGDINCEVRPEQNVDESHPVDIKVTWVFSSRAILEIKWLGKSRREDDGALTQDYSESRARSGARQLAEYLDSSKQHAPGQVTHGYLIVFDARRANTNERTVTLSKDDGFHYQNSEITYDPRYHESRADFEEPVRMFLEPLCCS